jgi:hypothetical protein
MIQDKAQCAVNGQTFTSTAALVAINRFAPDLSFLSAQFCLARIASGRLTEFTP